MLDELVEEVDRQEHITGRREQDPVHLPYWAELWESATGVGQFLERTWGGNEQPDRAAPCSVLDLGCGMGLSGTVAAALGARVMFADLEPPALLFARLNSLPHDPAGRRVRTRRLDWRTDRLGEAFDLIVGADILYERKQWEFLEPFWRAHLAPAGKVLLGEPGRPTGKAFMEWVRRRGWGLELFEERVPDRAEPIRVLRIQIQIHRRDAEDAEEEKKKLAHEVTRRRHK